MTGSSGDALLLAPADLVPLDGEVEVGAQALGGGDVARGSPVELVELVERARRVVVAGAGGAEAEVEALAQAGGERGAGRPRPPQEVHPHRVVLVLGEEADLLARGRRRLLLLLLLLLPLGGVDLPPHVVDHGGGEVAAPVADVEEGEHEARPADEVVGAGTGRRPVRAGAAALLDGARDDGLGGRQRDAAGLVEGAGGVDVLDDEELGAGREVGVEEVVLDADDGADGLADLREAHGEEAGPEARERVAGSQADPAQAGDVAHEGVGEGVLDAR